VLAASKCALHRRCSLLTFHLRSRSSGALPLCPAAPVGDAFHPLKVSGVGANLAFEVGAPGCHGPEVTAVSCGWRGAGYAWTGWWR
jgi:hypothetical protein